MHVIIHQSSLIDNTKFYVIFCEMVGAFCVQFDEFYSYTMGVLIIRQSDIPHVREKMQDADTEIPTQILH